MSEQTLDLLIRLGIAGAILLGGWPVIQGIGALARRALKHSRLDEALHLFILRLIKILLWVVLILTVLETVGVRTSSFLTLLGAVGVAVAFALRETLGNFAGGVLLLINKPFRRGDYIESAEAAGLVADIDLMYTTLKTYDNKVVTVPNGKLSNQTVVNFTQEPRRRIDFQFSILPQDSGDIERAKTIAYRLIAADSRILPEPAPTVVVGGQKEGYLVLEVRVWGDTNDYWPIKYEMEEKMVTAFREDAITVPRPMAEALRAGRAPFE